MVCACVEMPPINCIKNPAIPKSLVDIYVYSTRSSQPFWLNSDIPITNNYFQVIHPSFKLLLWTLLKARNKTNYNKPYNSSWSVKPETQRATQEGKVKVIWCPSNKVCVVYSGKLLNKVFIMAKALGMVKKGQRK